MIFLSRVSLLLFFFVSTFSTPATVVVQPRGAKVSKDLEREIEDLEKELTTKKLQRGNAKRDGIGAAASQQQQQQQQQQQKPQVRGNTKGSTKTQRGGFGATNSSYCHRPWPDLELLLPVALLAKDHDRRHEWRDVFLKSFMFYWPLKVSKTKLRMIYDHDVYTDLLDGFKSDLGALEKQWGFAPSSRINGGLSLSTNTFDPPVFHDMGHTRQQLVMFWGDIYSQSEYVGFVDTDTFFFTLVDREDLFESGKPVINGRIGKHQGDFWESVPMSSQWLMKGLEEPMRCMSYFPVIIKRQHLRELREFVERAHGKPFNDVFHEYSANSKFSQFGAMCSYLWWFKRDDYVWYVHDTDPDWNLRDTYKTEENMYFTPNASITDKTIFSPEMLLPKPRIAVHANYHDGEHPHLLALRGYCHSPPFPKISKVHKDLCKDIAPGSSLVKDMFSFEWMSWHKIYSEESMIKEQMKRHQRINKCTHSWDFRIAFFDHNTKFKIDPATGFAVFDVDTQSQSHN